MKTRRADSTDVAAICAICAEGWRATYASIETPERIESVIARYYTTERVSSELAPRDGWNGWYVAEVGDAIIGAGGGGLVGHGEGEVFVLYVRPDRKRQGAGSALLEAITEEMVTQLATVQLVSVHPKNEEANRFYRARGFVDAGVRGGVGEYAASWMMRRSIGKKTAQPGATDNPGDAQ